MNNLITKYRPQSFDEVVGQPTIVRALQQIVKKKDARVFLFIGPSGCGKTTLSRIVARAYGCEDNDSAILDVDAASKTGVEDMRNVQEVLQYRPFGGTGMRAIILDEAHRLSGNAFDSLLKAVEEPPPHVVWFFCTTNPTKIPKTIRTRAATFELKLVDDKALGELYDFVVDEERLDIPGDVADLLIKEAKGSPRQLLSNIVVARTAGTKKEAAELLKTAIESDGTLELCQLITYGNASWSKAMTIVKKMEGENPESIRIVIAAYLSKAVLGAKEEKNAGYLLERLDAFAEPYTSYEGMAPLLLSLGRALLSE